MSLGTVTLGTAPLGTLGGESVAVETVLGAVLVTGTIQTITQMQVYTTFQKGIRLVDIPNDVRLYSKPADTRTTKVRTLLGG